MLKFRHVRSLLVFLSAQFWKLEHLGAIAWNRVARFHAWPTIEESESLHTSLAYPPRMMG